MRAILCLLLFPAAALADVPLAERFSFSREAPGMTIMQALEIDGCEAVLTRTVLDPVSGARRLVETSRFEVEHYRESADSPPDSLDLTARRYFTTAGDAGLKRWLAALGETREDRDRGARMRELQLRVERGAFGAFAAANGYEMRSYLEGDPEPYYAMPLPAVSIELPAEDPDGALAAWRSLAGRCGAAAL